MSDPIRLRDDPAASPLLRALVAAAPRTPEMPADGVARTRARGRPPRSYFPAAAAAAGAWLGWKSLAAAAVAVAGVVWVAAHDADTTAPHAIEPPRPRASFVIRPKPAPPSPPPSSARVESPKPRPPTPTREPVRAPSPQPPSSVGPRDTSLDEEVRLLGEGRGALGGAPAKALELANLHAERHPRGQLVVERELLAVDALAALGRIDEARARARQALPLAQGSFLEARLRERAALAP